MSPADARRRAFLAALRECGTISRACAASGLDRGESYKLRKADPEFAAGWDAALESFADALEDEAKRRAVDGVERPVYQGGKLVGTVVERSDRLLEVMLKAKRPEYRERSSVELSGRLGVSVGAMTDDELIEALRAELAESPAQRQALADVLASLPPLPGINDGADLV